METPIAIELLVRTFRVFLFVLVLFVCFLIIANLEQLRVFCVENVMWKGVPRVDDSVTSRSLSYF